MKLLSVLDYSKHFASGRIILALTALLSSALFANRASAQNFTQANTDRVSIGTHTGAVEANSSSTNARTSRNGRFVVFESTATNLVTSPSVTGGRRHCYLLDRQAGTVELVSLRSNGTEAPFDCNTPVVSADGRYVAYSASGNTGEIGQMVSVCVADICHVNQVTTGSHIYIRDRLANKNFLADQALLDAQIPAMSNLGVMQRKATVIQGPDVCDIDGDSNIAETIDINLWDPVMTPVKKRFSAQVVTGGDPLSRNPFISGDGRYVTFDTLGDNLPGFGAPISFSGPTACSDYDRYDCPVGAGHTACNFDDDGFVPATYLEMGTGVFIDGNGKRDAYVRDGQEFSTKLVSLGCKYHAPNGCNVQGLEDSFKPAISDDGTYITFHSASPFLDLDFNLASDVFLVERSKINGEVADLKRVSNTTSRILAGNGASTNAAISGDGRYIAFESAATNLITSDANAKTDVFVYDRNFFVTVRCTNSGTAGDGDSTIADITGSGEYVTFQSTSANWGATTGGTNIFSGLLSKGTKGQLTGCSVELASPGASSTGGDAASTKASAALVPVAVLGVRTLKPDVVYQSLATNLHRGSADANGVSDIFQTPVCTATDLATDTDADGTVDCFDQCWKDDTKVVDTDYDGDGIANCEDGCPQDSQKRSAGICGCGATDNDTDLDGTPDCTDKCPTDPLKLAPGDCGCGIADTDNDNNKVVDCKQNTNNATPIPTATSTSTATPTPQATTPPAGDDFTAFTPVAPKVKRLSANAFDVTLSNAGVTRQIKQYNVVLSRGKVKTRSTRTKPTFRLSKLRKGRYTVAYTITATSGEVSKSSANSATFVSR